MEGRTALGLAIACGVLAVTMVSLDLAWNLSADVDSRIDGQWVTMARAGDDSWYDRPFYGGPECTSPEVRLVVNNDGPFARTVDVWAYYSVSGKSGTETLLRETWDIERFSQQSRELVVPAEAYTPTDPDQPFYAGQVTFVIGDWHLGVCVRGEA